MITGTDVDVRHSVHSTKYNKCMSKIWRSETLFTWCEGAPFYLWWAPVFLQYSQSCH